MERKECRDRQERKVGSVANKYVHNIIHSEFRGSKTTEFTLVILSPSLVDIMQAVKF